MHVKLNQRSAISARCIDRPDSEMLQRVSRRSQVQVQPFPGDGPCGHAGEYVLERLLRLCWLPAVDRPEV